jgi:hypothetical protein
VHHLGGGLDRTHVHKIERADRRREHGTADAKPFDMSKETLIERWARMKIDTPPPAKKRPLTHTHHLGTRGLLEGPTPRRAMFNFYLIKYDKRKCLSDIVLKFESKAELCSRGGGC